MLPLHHFTCHAQTHLSLLSLYLFLTSLLLNLGWSRTQALGQPFFRGIVRFRRQLSTQPAPSGAGCFFCSPQCSRSATSFALGHWASLSLAIDSISPIWRWSFPSFTMGRLCLFLIRRQLLPTLMSMKSNFATCEVISMFRRRFDTAQVKRSTLSLCRCIKDSQTSMSSRASVIQTLILHDTGQSILLTTHTFILAWTSSHVRSSVTMSPPLGSRIMGGCLYVLCTSMLFLLYRQHAQKSLQGQPQKSYLRGDARYSRTHVAL